jgi:hypothetical protein
MMLILPAKCPLFGRRNFHFEACLAGILELLIIIIIIMLPIKP